MAQHLDTGLTGKVGHLSLWLPSSLALGSRKYLFLPCVMPFRCGHVSPPAWESGHSGSQRPQEGMAWGSGLSSPSRPPSVSAAGEPAGAVYTRWASWSGTGRVRSPRCLSSSFGAWEQQCYSALSPHYEHLRLSVLIYLCLPGICSWW